MWPDASNINILHVCSLHKTRAEARSKLHSRNGLLLSWLRANASPLARYKYIYIYMYIYIYIHNYIHVIIYVHIISTHSNSFDMRIHVMFIWVSKRYQSHNPERTAPQTLPLDRRDLNPSLIAGIFTARADCKWNSSAGTASVSKSPNGPNAAILSEKNSSGTVPLSAVLSPSPNERWGKATIASKFGHLWYPELVGFSP